MKVHQVIVREQARHSNVQITQETIYTGLDKEELEAAVNGPSTEKNFKMSPEQEAAMQSFGVAFGVRPETLIVAFEWAANAGIEFNMPTTVKKDILRVDEVFQAAIK